ncbi:MAG: heme A synthase [Gammaproteobacteria bacterium]|nr:heme A synthase [Gammaproteobacteria bacterium]MYF28755.1 heme A synthase [Gammaproteobacteria bacterium]MYK47702.1 heme A synthase [Gammaproteobacteria bacterium]
MPEATPRMTNLVAVAVGLAAVVVVLGAYTRLVDAGLGCPDWPGCYGMILVPETAEEIARAEAAFPDSPVEADKAWPEMIHRYAAALLGLVVLAMAVLAIKERLPWKLPVALVLLVIAQGAFGAWTVTLKLWPQVVTTHLLGGFATLALLWVWWLGLRHPPWRVATSLRGLSTTALVVVVIQVALGGWLTANYAALACPDFPTCHGVWIPDMDFAAGFDIFQDVGPNYLGGLMSSDARVAIHVVHRLGAVAVLAVAGWLAFRMGARPLAWVLGGVLALQLALGIANVVFALPLAVAVLHNAGAAVLLLVVVTIYHSIRPSGA